MCLRIDLPACATEPTVTDWLTRASSAGSTTSGTSAACPPEERPRVPELTPMERLEFYGWTVTAGGCWEWGGQLDGRGYGKVRAGYRYGTMSAHRLSHEVHHGPIPAGLVVMHSCDNPPCINPAHLSAGTHADNMQDMIIKGRAGFQRRGSR